MEFYEYIEGIQQIESAFNMTFGDKFKVDGYCNVKRYLKPEINREVMIYELQKRKSPFAELYKSGYAQGETIDEVFSCIQEKFNYTVYNSEIGYSLSQKYPSDMFIADALTLWVFQSLGNEEFREEVIRDYLLTLFFEKPEKKDIENLNEVYFMNGIACKPRVEVITIGDLKQFCDFIFRYKYEEYEDGKTFYRGHSDINYKLLPSLMRNNNWHNNEKAMYNELKIRCPESFKGLSHIEVLTIMQHYDLPTRLLDITSNPLVALYFACASNEEKEGEVIIFWRPADELKYANSDTVSILASLPCFEYGTQQYFLVAAKSKISNKDFNLAVSRLLHEIKLEKPAYKDEIIRQELIDSFIVLPEYNNKRIMKQDGAFIISGLGDTGPNKFRLPVAKGKLVLVIKNKKEIMKQLDSMSINRATLFPEIDDVATYIKEKYQ